MPPKGWKHSEESKAKMGKSQRGRKHSEESKAKIRDALQGKERSREHAAKISEAKKGKPGHPLTEEAKRKISESKRGKARSNELKAKLSEMTRKRMEDPTVRAHLSGLAHERMEDPAAREKLSVAASRHFSDPAEREKVSARWDDPDFRKKHAAAGVKGFTSGSFTSTKTEDPMVHYRSSYELCFLRMVEADERVSTYTPEPFTIQYVSTHDAGRKRRYIPDFLLVVDGKQVLAEVKPANLIDSQVNQDKFAAARALCEKNGWTFKVFTETDLFCGDQTCVCRHWNKGDTP